MCRHDLLMSSIDGPLMGSNSDLSRIGGIIATEIGLPAEFDYFIPLGINDLTSGEMDKFADLKETDLSSWMIERPWAKTLLPNLLPCALNGLTHGPPRTKLKVTALTNKSTSTIPAVTQPKLFLASACPIIPPLPPPTTTAGLEHTFNLLLTKRSPLPVLDLRRQARLHLILVNMLALPKAPDSKLSGGSQSTPAINICLRW